MKKDTYDEFGFEPAEDSADYSEFGFEAEPDEMSQLEAAARGAAQGLTFDFGDELAGAAQAGVGALQGEEGSLKELYQKYRDEQRKQMEQAAEEYPVTYYGSDIAAGVLPALLTGGASAAASVGKSLAKGATKGSLKTAMKEAAKTGAKFGAVTGAGTSKAELFDGELGGLTKDTIAGGVLGGISGAAMPVLGKGVSKATQKTGDLLEGAVNLIPGAESTKLAYKGGKKGIGISQEEMIKEGKRVAKELNEKVSEVLSKSGVERKKAIELADEAGTRINAGEVIDDVINDIIEEGAIGLDIKGKEKLVQSVSLLKEGFYDQLQASKLESKLAGQVAKDQALHGSEVETVSSINKAYDELLPLPDAKGTVKGVNAKMSMKTPEGVVEYNKVLTQPLDDTVVKRIEYDAESMMPTELKSVIDYVNGNLVGDLSKPAKNANESKARELAVKLRGLLDDAVDEFADPTGAMKNTFRGMEKLGSKQAGRGTEQAVEGNIDSIAKKLLSTGTSSEIDKQRAFEKFRQASPEYSQVIDEAEFISKYNDKLGGMIDGVRTTNIRGLLGTAEGAVAKGANVAGKAVRNISEKAKPVTNMSSKVANKVGDVKDSILVGASEKMLSSNKKVMQEMGQQLQYALQQEGPIKSALIWSLSQNPLVRKIVNEQEENTAEDIGSEPMNIGTEETNTPEVDNSRTPSSLQMDEPMDRAKYIQKRLIDGGISEDDVMAILANIGHETKGTFDPKERQDVGSGENYLRGEDVPEDEWFSDSKKGRGTGLLQWDDRRKDQNRKDGSVQIGLKRFAEERGKRWDDIDVQIDYILYELKGREGSKFKHVTNAKSLEDKVKMFSEKVERPGIPHMENRLNMLKELQEKLKKLNKAIESHSSYINSGGSALESSTGDRTMGYINELPISEDEKDEMNQAVAEGDIVKLREMMNKYREMVG